MRPKLNLLAYYKDNHDGSSSTTFYNNEAELDKELAVNEYLYDDEKHLTVAKIREEDDPYENGYISDITFELNVDDHGNYSIAEPKSISFG
jgi:hypothetical protein